MALELPPGRVFVSAGAIEFDQARILGTLLARKVDQIGEVAVPRDAGVSAK